MQTQTILNTDGDNEIREVIRLLLAGEKRNILTLKNIKLSLEANEVWLDDAPIHLTDTEYRILRLLMSTPNQVFSAKDIFESAWHEPYYRGSGGVVMVHIHHLRTKIESDPHTPEHIKTVRNRGYRFEVRCRKA